jgi:hypothetical protein
MSLDEYGNLAAYCMFLGYPRSGHSLVGALLNAHPEIVIAHELDALTYVKEGIDREQLFRKILDSDQNFVQSGSQWNEYNYKVPGQWQGSYRELRVIGDKKGGRSALLLKSDPGLFNRLEALVELPVYVIHIVRNPFDNIATMSRKNYLDLSKSIENYLVRCRFINRFSQAYPRVRFITIRSEDIIESPALQLGQLCRFLGVEHDPDYIKGCSEIVFKKKSRTRDTVAWNDALMEKVYRAIREVPFLEGYTFDN